HRILMRPEPISHLLIDHHHWRRVAIVSCGEASTVHHRNAHRLEVGGADNGHVDGERRGARRLVRSVVAVYLNTLHAHDLAEGQMVGQARRLDAWQRAHLLEKARVELTAARFIEAKRLNIEAGSHGVVRVEPWINGSRVAKTSEGGGAAL